MENTDSSTSGGQGSTPPEDKVIPLSRVGHKTESTHIPDKHAFCANSWLVPQKRNECNKCAISTYGQSLKDVS